MIAHGLPLLILLLAGHALADYPLQGDFLSQGKNRHTALGAVWWPHALTAHAAIQAGVVTLLTGSAVLGIAEFAVHWVTDWLKCEDMIGVNADQAIHVTCKVIWWLLCLWVVVA